LKPVAASKFRTQPISFHHRPNREKKMRTQTRHPRSASALATLICAALPALAFAHGKPQRPPQLSPARRAMLIGGCEALQPQLAGLPNTVITGSSTVAAGARGPGNLGGVNVEVPVDWAPDRSRPLCPYPSVARYVHGSVEKASSFYCLPGLR
jgi:hypothetical protein